MTKLSVNINKIAVLRNSRGGGMPSVIEAARACERFGAQGITVHPRPDERHIRYADVRELAPIVTTEFNIEGNPVPSFVDLVLEVRPAQVTLVPDPPGAITSNAGWDTVTNAEFLRGVTTRFRKAGVRVSIFVDPDPGMVAGAAAVGADRVELYTERYASNHALASELEDASARDDAYAESVAPYLAAALEARRQGLGLNAGHDLNLDNLRYFVQTIPWTDEVSIGHALIADALYAGLEKTIGLYLDRLR
jgi:pyridoxine 5-phosphate synthase